MLKRFAQDLRYRQTDAEQKLWAFVRNRRLNGYKFRRQHIIDGYIVDFVCIGNKLIIELDGGIHVKQLSKDFARTQHLQDIGFRVLRYQNEEILTHMDEVLADIAKNPEERTPHSNLSPSRGERIRQNDL